MFDVYLKGELSKLVVFVSGGVVTLGDLNVLVDDDDDDGCLDDLGGGGGGA